MDKFGGFLQQANKELYGSKVAQVQFVTKVKGKMQLEWALKGKDLVVHVFSKDKWPFNYAKLLYSLMDKYAPGEKREVGYEDLVNSWYILSPDFGKSKLSPKTHAETLCNHLLDELTLLK